MADSDSETFHRKLEEFSRRLQARTAEFRDQGEFSDIHRATLRGIRERHDRLVERVLEAQHRGVQSTMIEAEFQRDFRALFDSFLEWEERADAEMMRASTNSQELEFGRPTPIDQAQGAGVMKTFLVMAGNGALVVATSHDTLTDPEVVEKLRAKGVDKFIAYELPSQLVKERYGGHFDVAMQDLHQLDDLRIIDFDGEHALRLFHSRDLGRRVVYESDDS